MLDNTQIRILNFILVQTGTYREQAVRPFITTFAPDTTSALAEATNGGQNLGPAAVQGLAGQIIQPQATIEGFASISEGWNSRRFRFLMVVEEKHPLNPHERTQRVLFGYTDHCQATMNYLDPQMRIYFNSETVIRDFVRPTPNGPITETMVIGANQIVSPITMAGSAQSSFYNQPTTYMLRPEDIFSQGQSQHIVNKIQMSDLVPGVDAVFNTQAMVGANGGFKYSNRRNTAPSRYLSDTLKAYSHAVSEARINDVGNGGLDREYLYGEAQNAVRSQSISSNPFFGRLKDMAGFMEQGYVTFQDFVRIFPEASEQYNVTKYALDDGRSIRQVNRMEHSEHWAGSDHITIAAATLAQVVPAIMMDNYLRSISFAATNGHGLGQFAIEIHGDTLRGIVDNLPLGPYLQEFERRLIFDALVPLTHNNQVGFQISMASDLAGDSVIDIAIGAEPVRRYIAPTFTDSLFTPIITQQHDHQEKIVNDLLYLVGEAIPYSRPGVEVASPVAKSTQQLTQGMSYEPHYSRLL